MLVFCVPGIPVAKGRPRVIPIGGGKTQTHTPDKTVSFEGLVAYAAAAAGARIVEGPMCIVVIAVWPYRRGDPKRIRESGLCFPKDTKPDYDNIVKGVSDGLEGVAYAMDSRVVFGQVETLWGPSPGTYVKVWKTTRDGRVLPGWCR